MYIFAHAGICSHDDTCARSVASRAVASSSPRCCSACKRVHVYMNACAHTNIQTNMYACTHTRARAHTHTHTQTHTYTCFFIHAH